MKHSLFKSIRMKMAFYSLISAIATVITDAIIITAIAIIKGIDRYNVLGNRQGISNFSNNLQADSFQTDNIAEKVAEEIHIKMEPVLTQNLAIDVLLLICLTIFLFMAYYILVSHDMITYFRQITLGVEKIKNGDYYTNIYVRGDDEISELAASINDMRMELRDTIENERSVEKTKNELITNVAHDLRTPLTSIIGYLELIRNTENIDTETQMKYTNIAYDKSIRLQSLIDELFDYTRYEKNKIKLKKVEIDLLQFMEQLVEEFYPSFCENKLKYYTVFPREPIKIYGDGDLLARAISNLLSNAIKYGKNGKQIKVELHNMEYEGKVRIAITNYGDIIPEKDIDKVFNKFYRVENSRSEATGGTGLGLAIAKNIIEMHDGEINVSSDVNGTVFEIILNIIR